MNEPTCDVCGGPFLFGARCQKCDALLCEEHTVCRRGIVACPTCAAEYDALRAKSFVGALESAGKALRALLHAMFDPIVRPIMWALLRAVKRGN